nr:MAG TPA_asm: hypothetical protein [Caudoviricetes sp.]
MVRQRVTVHAASNHQCTSSTLRRHRDFCGGYLLP